jgi:hypothetical protein
MSAISEHYYRLYPYACPSCQRDMPIPGPCPRCEVIHTQNGCRVPPHNYKH